MGSRPPLTTPSRIKGQILDFCRQDVGINSDPVFVEVKAEGFRQKNDCYGDVRRCVQRNGGEEQQGWIIWERVGFLLQAEHHAVWLSPDGEMIDVSHKPDGETRILFLVDSRKLSTAEPIAPIHRLLSNDPITRQDIADAEERHRLRTAFKRREAPIPTRERVGRNDPCTCGSGKKYKKCCGKK